jgi:hypothetical protein
MFDRIHIKNSKGNVWSIESGPQEQVIEIVTLYVVEKMCAAPLPPNRPIDAKIQLLVRVPEQFGFNFGVVWELCRPVPTTKQGATACFVSRKRALIDNQDIKRTRFG